VFNQSSLPSTLPLWKRIAVFLSFLAVLSALSAPASVLAEEMLTGKLGGLCSVNMATNTVLDGSVEAAASASHCDACASLAYALPPFASQSLPSQPDLQLAGIELSFDLAALVEGLPPSRGPPAL
jgi:hypothetical protein